jgi:hypothetical protein
LLSRISHLSAAAFGFFFSGMARIQFVSLVLSIVSLP